MPLSCALLISTSPGYVEEMSDATPEHTGFVYVGSVTNAAMMTLGSQSSSKYGSLACSERGCQRNSKLWRTVRIFPQPTVKVKVEFIADLALFSANRTCPHCVRDCPCN
jgi:hypothetical protein